MTNNSWESDELNLKNELKLIDDSYYRVYDDNDYEIWRERMLSIIDNQTKSSMEAKSSESVSEIILNRENQNESTVNEINPIRPVFLDLPVEIIIKGIEKKAPNIENCNMNVSWGMKYLLGEIDQKCQDTAEKTRFKSILLDSKPGRSKWNNPNRIGQDELYQGLEKVLLDLKSYTPYSIPFLVKVSKKDVPDYYNVIKKPMDLGTMGKKLKNQEYNSKQQFIDDLNLIYSNCFTYNTAEDSIYRQHIQMLRDKWTYLLKSVPDIVVGKSVPELEKKANVPQGQSAIKETITPTFTANLTPNSVVPASQAKQVSSDPFDDLDNLLNAHLESLSDSESCPSPKKSKKSTSQKSQVNKSTSSNKDVTISEDLIDSFSYPKRSYFNELNLKIPKRSEKLMVKYSTDFKSASKTGKSKDDNRESDSSFMFPELVYFFNTVPDSHLIKRSTNSTVYCPSYTSTKSMNRYYDNFRILQTIRDLRKHILEGSRAEVPGVDHLKKPTSRFDVYEPVLRRPVENEWQAKAILRKIITLFLAQAGFELISNSALYALYEFIEWNFKKLFDALKLFNEQFSEEKDSADILRLVLLQLNICHLSDLEVVAVEDSYAKSRLEGLLSVMSDKVEEYESIIRLESTEDQEAENDEDNTEETGDNNEDNEDEEDQDELEDQDQDQLDQEIDDEGEDGDGAD